MRNQQTFLEQFENMPGVPVVAMEFGSHLYGLNTPNSDYDYQGIFVPSRRDWVLGKAPKNIQFTTGDGESRNTSDDVDISFTNIVKFIDDALKGEVFAIDMLHCKQPIHSSVLWDYIIKHRKRFYSKGMKAYIGYLKRQVHKYGVKGSRMAELEVVFKSMDKLKHVDTPRVEDLVLVLPYVDMEYVEYDHSEEQLYMLGKKFGLRAHLSEVYNSMSRIYENYGARAQAARDNDGVDWKAVSHALRAGYQQRDIFTLGDFEYPLRENEFILAVKKGELDFVTQVQPELDSLVDQVTELAETAVLPQKPDVAFWENFLYHKVFKQTT